MGPSNYLGEIGGVYEPRGFLADLQLKKTRMGINAFARYNFTDKLAVSGGLAHGWIEGADSLSLQPSRFSRNLSFRNQIFELYARAEVDLFAFEVRKRGGRFRLRLAPFMFFGGAVFYHNPKAYYNGQWYALQPLATEGIQYNRLNVSLPVGGGLSLSIGRHHNFGWELGWRQSFTDYLDDVSTTYIDPNTLTGPVAQKLAMRSDEVNPNNPNFIGTDNYTPGSPRGNPETNDSYLMSYFTYSYEIGGRGKGFKSKSRYNLVRPSHKSINSKMFKKKRRRPSRKLRLFRKKHLHPHF